MITVHIFHTGKVRVDRAIPYRENNPLAVTGFLRSNKKKVLLPVSCYLIEHPKGRILIDTGWNTKYANQRPKEWFGLVDKISSPVINISEGIDSKLAVLGLTDKDIDAVYFSHLDFDHTSGIPLVRNAKAFYASAEEKNDAKKSKLRYIDTWSGIVDVQTFKYNKSGIGPVGRSYDVFGDGKVLLVNTPGHSHGLFSVKVSNAGKYLVLANDTVYTQKSIQKKILPGLTVNKARAKKSINWICSCAEDKNCIFVAGNHDPSVKEQRIDL